MLNNAGVERVALYIGGQEHAYLKWTPDGGDTIYRGMIRLSGDPETIRITGDTGVEHFLDTREVVELMRTGYAYISDRAGCKLQLKLTR